MAGSAANSCRPISAGLEGIPPYRRDFLFLEALLSLPLGSLEDCLYVGAGGGLKLAAVSSPSLSSVAMFSCASSSAAW